MAKPEATHQENVDAALAIHRMKDQMLIVLIKRLADENGEFRVPVAEVDDTHMDVLTFESDRDNQEFIFRCTKKS